MFSSRILRTCFHVTMVMFIASVTTSGQSLKNKYTIRNFNDENGLPQNSVKLIVADNLGFVWLKTESGLARFDGQRIVNISKFFNPGIDRYISFVPDIFGKTDKIYTHTSFAAPIRIENGIAVADTTYQLQEGLISMGFTSSWDSGLVQNVSEGLMDALGVDTKTDSYIIAGCRGCSYAVSKNQITYYSDFQLRWTKNHNFRHIRNFFTLEGQLFYFTEEGTIIGCGKETWHVKRIYGDVLSDRDWKAKKNRARLFANTINQQAFVLIGDRFYRLKYQAGNSWDTELLSEGFSFIENNIVNAYFDERSGNLLLGSLTRGLTVIAKKAFTGMIFDKDDLKNVVYSQIVLDSNRILLPGGRIVDTKGFDTGIIKNVNNSGVLRDVAIGERRYGLRDKGGRIWMTEGHFIVVLSPSGDKILRKIEIPDGISVLYEMWDGQILVGAKDRGLFSVSAHSSEVKAFYSTTDMRYVVCMKQTDSSHLLLGTEKGLYRLNLATGLKDLIPGTENLFIRSLYIRGKSNELFFTTFNHGFFYYGGKNITNFPLDANRYLAAAHCIVEDHHGYFWITTNRGLFQVRVDDLYKYAEQIRKGEYADLFYLYHTKEEGFNTNEFNGGCSPCAVRLKNGFVSLPSLKGVVLFEPEQTTPVVPDSPLVIDLVEERNVLRQITGDSVQLSLNPRNVSFHISTVFFGNPENLHISYVLKVGTEQPSDHEWLPVEEGKPIARFSEIASGEYTLWVRKTDGFGSNNYSIQKLAVSVPLHWYEMFWFRIALAVFVLGLVYALFYIRTRRLLVRNQQLEMHVAERTQNLQETLGSLQTSEKELSRQIQLQTRLVASISHDVVTPIHYFAKASDMAGEMIQGEGNDGARELLKEVSSSARSIHTFVDNLVNFSKSQIYGLHTKARPVLVHKLIEDKVRVFESVLSQRGISFHNGIPKELEIATSPQLLGIIVHNLIDNALKHSYEQYDVHVKTERKVDGMHLIFSNPGQGFPDSVIQWLNKPPHGDHEVPQEYSGLGLLIIKEIAEILNVGLYAENNHGAHVHLIFADYME